MRLMPRGIDASLAAPPGRQCRSGWAMFHVEHDRDEWPNLKEQSTLNHTVHCYSFRICEDEPGRWAVADPEQQNGSGGHCALLPDIPTAAGVINV